MRIREASGGMSKVAGSVKHEVKREISATGTSFHNSLVSAENTEYELYMSEIAEKIAKQGEKLAKRVDISELRIYKRLISEFIDGALGSSVKFSKQSILDRRGRHRVYALIKKINQEISLLTEDVLSREKDNIVILKRIEDIKGLVLDMVL